MSVYQIFYQGGAKMMRPISTRAEYMALRDSEQNRRADKKHLVQMNYSCLPNVKNENDNENEELRYENLNENQNENEKGGCGPLKGSTRESNSVGMDIDLNGEEWTVEKEKRAVRDQILAKREELGLLMLEESYSKGYHIVFRRRTELSQVDNLRWASSLLGVEFDKGAKDITRVFFTPAADKLIFLSEEIFVNAAAERVNTPVGRVNTLGEGGNTREARVNTSAAGLVLNPAGEGKSNTTEGSINKSAANINTEGINGSKATINTLGINTSETSINTTYNGFAYEAIISKYWELFNAGKEPCEGNRNTLTFELAMMLRHICGFDREKLNEVIPDYWESSSLPREGWGGVSEKLQCIDSALKEPRKGMPYRLRQVMEALQKEVAIRATGGTPSTPPPMPQRLPKLIQLLTRNVPAAYKPAVASAVFPALATHLHGVKFRYWDNVEHEATFMNVLVGRQSVGKGCIKKPIELIMQDIVERDRQSRQREAEWKRQNPAGKSKAKDPRPVDICIQMLIDNLTDAVFNQRIVDANTNGERYVYTIVDEIEALKKVTSRGTVDEVLLLIRKAFDNALAGQERVGPDSVSGIAPLRWNWNASTTPPNVRRFFAKGVNDGTVSRLDVATIFCDEESDTIPVMGIYDEAFVQELKPYIARLESANGLVECAKAKRLALDMREENSATAGLYDSEAYRVLSYRANVIAWLKGMLLYIAQGYRWDRTIEDFVRWSEQYNLWCKMLYFGNQLEEELREEKAIQNASGPRNLLDLLPDEFNKEQYRLMRAQQGKTGDGESTLRSWVFRGHIAYDEVTGCYVKKRLTQES
jgi:hypothetical protein